MSDIVIIVGETEAEVRAVAWNYRLTIVSAIEEFSGLDTYSAPNMSMVGVIQANRHGYIALARPY